MSKSIIIIGKGYSVTKCTKEFVDSHDDVAIINSPVYSGYDHLISDHADYLFTNKTGMLYDSQQIKRLGLREMIFTGVGHQRFQRTTKEVKMVYPNPNIFDYFDKELGFWPNSGLQAIYYLLNNGSYNEISLVGFDFYQLGLPPYYFGKDQAHSEIKYLWNKEWAGNIINTKNLHNEDKTMDYLLNLIETNGNVTFNIITLNDNLRKVKIDNLNIINNE